IAHTRWATHGKPTKINAHPHCSDKQIAIVHNGIIENYERLRAILVAKGYKFVSQTDSETIAHLIHFERKGGKVSLLSAVQKAVKQFDGAYGICVADASEPDKLIVARSGSPLVIGVGIGENFVASDPLALGQVTDRFIYLEELMRYPGVFDISDSFRAGKQEVQIQILERGKTLGLTLNDIATQVRQAFYGAESQRIQRGSDDIRVMVRYPEPERQSLGNLEGLLIRTPAGAEVPFLSIATFSLGSSYSSINRRDGRRVITVRGDVDRTVVKPEEIQREIIGKYRAQWARDLDVELVLGGEAERGLESLEELYRTFPIAMMVIFALLAIPLKSYAQPLIIMSVIPFGAIGAIFGHFIMGADLVFFSLLGIIALSGVVVNASLVLVLSINRLRDEGVGMVDAVSEAGMMRFRPIVLTSVTTFIGLVPLMATANPATFFIIPMAISLSFGVLFATMITLFLVPSLYLILHDFTGHTDTAEERKLAYQD
ncbi:efflux RND transporter permease subunit, partial [Gammaproteobacteria bacterium]|nr:efflux RND transporter permease subunit [Gammaproteobacteria bacterium]